MDIYDRHNEYLHLHEINWKEHATHAASSETILCSLLNLHYVATSHMLDEPQMTGIIERRLLMKLTPEFAEAMLLWMSVSDQTGI